MLKRLIDKAETLLAYIIVATGILGLPLFLFIHVVTTPMP